MYLLHSAVSNLAACGARKSSGRISLAMLSIMVARAPYTSRTKRWKCQMIYLFIVDGEKQGKKDFTTLKRSKRREIM